MMDISIKDDYIKLGQVMKLANLVSSGAEAKSVINEGMVRVNKEKENRRGRKLYDGDIVSYEENEIRIIKE